jgi:cellobiose phosphorylase
MCHGYSGQNSILIDQCGIIGKRYMPGVRENSGEYTYAVAN